jgi:hypoxanthine-DNA glycosylase
MPGKVSLRAQQYYAHPRNAFWKLMGTLLGFDADVPYPERLEHLTKARIALWDVLKTCTRESSLDSDIVDDTSVPNDFASFFATHPGITRVFFNGEKAESSFRKLVLPTLGDGEPSVFVRLPSTSPANASIPYERKRADWGQVVV